MLKRSSVGRYAHETHANENCRTDNKEEDCIVKKIHRRDILQKLTLQRTSLCLNLDNETKRAKHKSSEERCDRAFSIHAIPKNAEEKTGGDWRSDIRLHTLQIDVHAFIA